VRGDSSKNIVIKPEILFGKLEEKIMIKRRILEGDKRKGSGNRNLYIQGIPLSSISL